jgi:Abnormal spindle-like microcephaly-assoc'd, ASPM-SPD-2-Hydin
MQILPFNSKHFRRLPPAMAVVVALTLMSLPVSAAKRSQRTQGSLVANPNRVSFGNVQTGATQSQFETLTNPGTSSFTIYKSNVTGTGFSAGELTLPLTLAPGQSVTFTLAFAPQAAGSVTGNFSVSSKFWRSNVSVPLSGTGTPLGQLSISPGRLNFGNVTVGSSSSVSSTLSASGESITISSVTTTSSEFSISGFSLPLTIAAGQSVPFSVIFSPNSSGSASATLAFVSTSASVSQGVSGTGIAPSHSVTLSWTDTSSGISGYNVYRAGTSGGPYAQISPSLDPSTGYVDTSVAAGQTYYYVTTAVDTNGAESPYSNQVQAVIPSP